MLLVGTWNKGCNRYALASIFPLASTRIDPNMSNHTASAKDDNEGAFSIDQDEIQLVKNSEQFAPGWTLPAGLIILNNVVGKVEALFE